jgi:hypothetical protein
MLMELLPDMPPTRQPDGPRESVWGPEHWAGREAVFLATFDAEMGHAHRAYVGAVNEWLGVARAYHDRILAARKNPSTTERTIYTITDEYHLERGEHRQDMMDAIHRADRLRAQRFLIWLAEVLQRAIAERREAA